VKTQARIFSERISYDTSRYTDCRTLYTEEWFQSDMYYQRMSQAVLHLVAKLLFRLSYQYAQVEQPSAPTRVFRVQRNVSRVVEMSN